jgi:hypothetical protein
MLMRSIDGGDGTAVVGGRPAAARGSPGACEELGGRRRYLMPPAKPWMNFFCANR